MNEDEDAWGESAVSMLDRTCTYDAMEGYELERSVVTATDAGEVVTITDKRTVTVQSGVKEEIDRSEGSSSEIGGRVGQAHQMAYYGDQWQGLYGPMPNVVGMSVPRRPAGVAPMEVRTNTYNPVCTVSHGPSNRMDISQPCFLTRDQTLRACWGKTPTTSDTSRGKGLPRMMNHSASWPIVGCEKGGKGNIGGKRVKQPRLGQGDSNYVDEERVNQAEELWTVLNNPSANSPENPETEYSQAVIMLARKGLKFLSALRETGSFAKARQASKSWLRACRHKNVAVEEPEVEYAALLMQYRRNRRAAVLEEENL